MIDTILLLAHPPSDSSCPASANDQWSWLEDRLRSSTADYIFVAGHYPVWSTCAYGQTPALVRHLVPLLEQYGAHYFAGHDHCHIHMVHRDVHYVVTALGYVCMAGCRQVGKLKRSLINTTQILSL